MVGHKLGEFVPTRQFLGHTPADKKASAGSASAPVKKDTKQMAENSKKLKEDENSIYFLSDSIP